MEKPLHISGAVSVLPSYVQIPGLGLLPANAYVVKSTAPVLIDTGLPADTDEFMNALRSVIDPRDLRWIWLTHIDQDHVGSLRRLLDEAPRAKVVTNFLGLGKLGLVGPPPLERVHLLNPGQSIDAGDRTLFAVAPPTYDAPETMGVYDGKSHMFFSSDCFGAILNQPAEDAAAIAPDALREGQTLWTTIDSPWLRHTSDTWLAGALDDLRRMQPRAVLSSHLPPAFGMTETFADALVAARNAAPFIGPDQPAFEEALASLAAA
ncbi:MAG TPA: MBL fold metallo-hydrolase [Povalibacter sp.]|uniref:MBL fold metallo-hydrolase n=1 Tax=Povalibacter sp. TaxID=1962978 RepID=UPI002BA223DF|nr:MBL fold metallo-hydrolase [Povalibacter sp.]HMN44097.1 MBL fold metallo-hydrolase [Povalibacter sp.]